MSDIRKHMYMHDYPFVCTQAGTRGLTRKEERIAIAYLLDVEKTHTNVWAIVTSGIAIVTGIVVGFAAYVLSVF